MGTARRAGGRGKLVYAVMATGVAGLLAIWFCRSLLSASGERTAHDLVEPVSAAAAYKGDIGVYLDSLGTVNPSNSVILDITNGQLRVAPSGMANPSNSVFFQIPQEYCQEVINKFDAHQTLTVEADNVKGERVGHGYLAGVDNLIDTSTGTLKCRATLFPEGGNLMIPGLLLNLRMLLEMKHGVTVAPAEAILYDPKGAFVWAIKPDQTVSRRQVKLGARDNAKVEILSGLSPGEMVATSGFNTLKEGQRVRFDLAQTVSLEPAEAKKLGFGETNAEILKIQLEQAEKDLALTEQRYKAGVVPGEEFYAAQLPGFHLAADKLLQ